MAFKLRLSLSITISLLLSSSFVVCTDYSEDDILQSIDQMPVTCSSTVRVQNVRSGYFLHSHELSYGTGSGQQSVTGMDNDRDYNSLWSFKEAEQIAEDGQDVSVPCRAGQKLKCGDLIRLEHMNTQRNLHSHGNFDSPISGRQEVSAFGTNGDGDGGDNWEIECESDEVNGKYVYGKTKFYFKHRDTGLYLYTDGGSKYNEYNCRRCPIIGQSEISGARGKLKNALWKVHSGFFFPDIEAQEYFE